MTSEAIYDKLTAIFRKNFADASIVLRPETTESDIAGWDSFNNASLIAAIEKEFGVRFKTAELQKLDNLGNYVALIGSKLQNRA